MPNSLPRTTPSRRLKKGFVACDFANNDAAWVAILTGAHDTASCAGGGLGQAAGGWAPEAGRPLAQ
jgi:hypothetical protein